MITSQLRARLDRLVARCPQREAQEIIFVSVAAGWDEGGRMFPPRTVELCRAIPGVDPRDRVKEIPLDSPDGVRILEEFTRKETAVFSDSPDWRQGPGKRR